MKKLIRQNTKNILVAALLIVSRFHVLPNNFSPLGSFGFFGKSLFWYIFAILAFDVFYGGFYVGVTWNYLAFLMYPLLGYFAGKSLQKQLVFLPIASFSFFLISNTGVWWVWKPHTIESLMQTYLLGIPFFKNTLGSDLIFGGSFAIISYNKEVIAMYLKKYQAMLARVYFSYLSM